MARVCPTGTGFGGFPRHDKTYIQTEPQAIGFDVSHYRAFGFIKLSFTAIIIGRESICAREVAGESDYRRER